MSREIKFRAWDKEENKIHYPLDNNSMKNSELLDRFPNYIMQYTGLKDKNDVEIYEGDIVANDINKWVIKCWKNMFEMFINNTDEFPTPPACGFEKYEPRLKVIGNIYENPELLEEIENE